MSNTIRKQSVFGSIIAVIGVGLGFVNSGVLQPKFLDLDEIGILRYVLSLTGLFSIFSSLGIATILYRYLPISKKENYQNELSGLYVLVIVIGHLLGLVACYVYLNFLQDELSAAWFSTVYLFFSATFLFSIFTAWLNASGNVSLTLFIREVYIKLGFVLALLALYYFAFNFVRLLQLIEVVYYGAAFLAVLFIIKNKTAIKPSFNFLKTGPMPLKAISSLALFSVLSGSVTILSKEVDILMVARILDFDATGIYSIMLFFGVLISVPSRGLIGISSVKIGEAWAQNNLGFLKDLYEKTAQNQLFVAGFVFVMLNANLFAVLDVIPKGDIFSAGIWVVFWLGLAQLVDMASGVSGEILYYSQHYKYGFYFSLVLLICLVVFNFIFIPIYGINGAAFATFLSQVVNNAARWVFLKRFYKLQPFNSSYLKALLFTIVLSAYALIVREFFTDIHFILAALVISVPIVLLYVVVVLKSSWAPDLKDRFAVYAAKLGINIK